MTILSRIYTSSPKDLVDTLRTKLRPLRRKAAYQQSASAVSAELRKRFGAYQTSNLRTIGAEEFEQYIESRIGTIDANSEGYTESELDRQRDLSVKFHWGHNHDFGEFKIEGRMADRHINLLANCTALFPVTIQDFQNKKVFDIGCWTGGTTLLLASLGGTVVAIEEVKKYAEMASFLSRSFGLDERVLVRPMSIYDCNSEEFQDQFDIVFFPGVIYHLSDPLLSLRILFNSLKLGGIILVESAGIHRRESFCRFDGSLVHGSGQRERLDRSGWNWFLPSPTALSRMMREAGFDQIQTEWHAPTNRIYGYGRKTAEVGICRAGLSIPDIK